MTRSLQDRLSVSFTPQELSFLQEQPAFREAVERASHLPVEEGLELLCEVGTALVEDQYGPCLPRENQQPPPDSADRRER